MYSTGTPVVTIDPNGTAHAVVLGANLPRVDPNNYSGQIHFGAQQTVSGPLPSNITWSDPNAAATLNFNRPQ